jgi:hypothetical protein
VAAFFLPAQKPKSAGIATLQAHCINFYSVLHEKTKKNARKMQKSLAHSTAWSIIKPYPARGKPKSQNKQ